MADVLCLGEILVDWVSTKAGAELDSADSFTKAPGGAPANVAVGLARQGIATAFIGRVAADAFGTWLKNLLRHEGIDTTSTATDSEATTRMAYVVTTASGDRKLAEFSRIRCADALLQESDLKSEMFAKACMLHFGSISLISNPAAAATEKAVKLARENNMIISYDPNVRLGLWPSEDGCKGTILDTLTWADVVKINLDELEFLTGSRAFESADLLRKQHDVPLLIVTLDQQGCYFTTGSGNKTVGGFTIKLVEATGAGDGFVSAILAQLVPLTKNAQNRRSALAEIPVDVLHKIASRANAVGALACTKAGAIPALPTLAEIDSFIEKMSAQTSS